MRVMAERNPQKLQQASGVWEPQFSSPSLAQLYSNTTNLNLAIVINITGMFELNKGTALQSSSLKDNSMSLTPLRPFTWVTANIPIICSKCQATANIGGKSERSLTLYCSLALLPHDFAS